MAQNTASESYAIFQTGGKQYQAIVGKTVEIEKLRAQQGESITFDQVLVRKVVDSDGKSTIEIGQPYLGTPIKASIIKHERGPKIIVFRFQRRKKYKRKAGHRQTHTIIRIEAI